MRYACLELYYVRFCSSYFSYKCCRAWLRRAGCGGRGCCEVAAAAAFAHAVAAAAARSCGCCSVRGGGGWGLRDALRGPVARRLRRARWRLPRRGLWGRLWRVLWRQLRRTRWGAGVDRAVGRLRRARWGWLWRALLRRLRRALGGGGCYARVGGGCVARGGGGCFARDGGGYSGCRELKTIESSDTGAVQRVRDFDPSWCSGFN